MKHYRKFLCYQCQHFTSHFVHFHSGPDQWHSCYPHAAGTRQSPIDIKPVNLPTLDTNQKLQWKYTPENTEDVSNPGYCWKVHVNGDGSGNLFLNVFLQKI